MIKEGLRKSTEFKRFAHEPRGIFVRRTIQGAAALETAQVPRDALTSPLSVASADPTDRLARCPGPRCEAMRPFGRQPEGAKCAAAAARVARFVKAGRID